MKLSLSNLSWGDTPIQQMIPLIEEIGIQGIEIAPTAIWPELKSTRNIELRKMRDLIESHGLEVSGLQSLLYGHKDYQLFSRSTWPRMRSHLEFMFSVASILGAKVLVFGSPRNRVRGNLQIDLANQIACEFFTSLIPSLEKNNLVMTLEPNAPEYGCDFLLTYEEVRNLTSLINSDWVKPQIDTGCLWMVREDPSSAFHSEMPHHVHLSNPNLQDVPGDSNFDNFLSLIRASEYKGWLVIESLGETIEKALHAAKWLKSEIGDAK